VAVAALTIYGLGSLISKKGRLVFASVAEMFSKEQTPTSEFYVVTKNVIDPAVDASRWQLSIGGLVSNPTTYSYADLQALATIDEFVTLECVSNEVGGNLISMAEWTGVRLANLLQSAGADSTADWIVFTCADGYTAAIPIAKAMDRCESEGPDVGTDLGVVDVPVDATSGRIVPHRRPRIGWRRRSPGFRHGAPLPQWRVRLRCDHTARFTVNRSGVFRGAAGPDAE